MGKNNKKTREYEPPQVKEISGVFEQAIGLSSCVTGSSFQTDCSGGGKFGQACSRGNKASGGCVVGKHDSPQQCKTGSSVTGCSMGIWG